MNNLWDRSKLISSAEVIAANEDLITKILLHLAAKSLVRFKCVSKEWFNLISNPYFSSNHTRRNSSLRTSSLLMIKGHHYHPMIRLSLGHENTSSVARFRIPFFDFFSSISDISMRILGFSNGLTLSYLSSATDEYNFAYCVCNLTTKRYIILPKPGLIINKPILGLNLAFDPSNSPHFKVVCIGQSCMLNDRNCQIEIYSSETGLWRRWNGSFLNTFHPLEIFDRGVLCNGAIHWLCNKADFIYFVLEDESLKTLPMPPMNGDIHTTKRSRYLGQSGGYLHLVHIESNMYHKPPMDIYELKKDYSGWVLKHRVDVDDIGCAFPEMVAHVQIPNEYFENEVDGIHLSRYYLYSVLSIVRCEEDEHAVDSSEDHFLKSEE